jgi:ABC-type nickel/cobalt efflux system permease component RcnA
MRTSRFQATGSTARDLARLLAVWLAAVLLVQGLAATLSLVHGPAHRHAAAVAAQLGAAHAHAHEQGLNHQHGSGEQTLPGGGEADGLDAAAVVLLAVLTPLSTRFDWAPAQGREALPAYGQSTHADAPASQPRKPPRA